MDKESKGGERIMNASIDYKKEYLQLSIENKDLKKENEKYKKVILSMASIYVTNEELIGVIKNIEKELKHKR